VSAAGGKTGQDTLACALERLAFKSPQHHQPLKLDRGAARHLFQQAGGLLI
jgi:hypothetical protein